MTSCLLLVSWSEQFSSQASKFGKFSPPTGCLSFSSSLSESFQLKTVIMASAFLVGAFVSVASAQVSSTHVTSAKPAIKAVPDKATGLPPNSAVFTSSAAAWVGGSDDCLTPTPIAGQGLFAYDQTGATTGAEGQTESLCYAFGTTAMNDDVWFEWTADATGTVIIDTCGDSQDTRMAAYPVGGCPISGSAIVCNDDACGLQSSISFDCALGTNYLVQVGTFSAGFGGPGELEISIGSPPANDDCALPELISGQGRFAFANALATTGVEGQSESNCLFFGEDDVDNDVWFEWTADVTGIASVDTCATSIDSKLVAWPVGGCPVDGTSLACNDDACGLQSRLQFAVSSGTSYLIQVGTFPGTEGGVDMMDISIGVPPANDECMAPALISGSGSFAYDNSLASTGAEGQGNSLCYAFGSTAIDNDLWFEWTTDADGTAIVSTCGSLEDTKLAAYPGAGCPAQGSAIGCNDDTCGLQSTVSFDVVNGSTYTLQVGNFPGAGGGPSSFEVSIVVPRAGYAYDLGLNSAGLGLTGGGALAWMHGFDTSGSDVITEVSSAYGTPLLPGLTPILNAIVAIWDDPTNDFNPLDATLLYSAPITTANEDTGALNAYPIPDVAVTGVFFVGIICENMNNEFPAPMDQTFSSMGRAWVTGMSVAGGGFAGFDSANLAANDFSPTDMDAIGYPSVFLLRAIGSGATLGSSYCTGAANSVDPSGSSITAVGSTSIAATALELIADNAPSQPAIFYYGPNQLNLPFGNGVRCVGGSVNRLPVEFGSGGEIRHLVDVPANAANFGSMASVNFQCWYRDPAGGGASFNLSDGVEIAFQP
ncbi:MAG: hypothetical protein ACI835_002481 [Planctomycetota bacterium]